MPELQNTVKYTHYGRKQWAVKLQHNSKIPETRMRLAALLCAARSGTIPTQYRGVGAQHAFLPQTTDQLITGQRSAAKVRGGQVLL